MSWFMSRTIAQTVGSANRLSNITTERLQWQRIDWHTCALCLYFLHPHAHTNVYIFNHRTIKNKETVMNHPSFTPRWITVPACVFLILFVSANQAFAQDTTIINKIEEKLKYPCYSDCKTEINISECRKGCDCFYDKVYGGIYDCIDCEKSGRYDNLPPESKPFVYCCRYLNSNWGYNDYSCKNESGCNESCKKGVDYSSVHASGNNWRQIGKNLKDSSSQWRSLKVYHSDFVTN